jgi:hypothetical protein
MNTTKSVYNKLFKEEATELASHEVNLASLDMVKAMTQDSLSLYKRGQEYAKEMEAFIKKSRVLNAEADALSKGLEKELNEFEKQAKDLGLNVSTLPEFKKAVDSLGPLDNIFKMTQRFK